jgi:hypothetical protein
LRFSLRALVVYTVLPGGLSLIAHAATTDACAVLTPAQIQSVLGVAVDPGQPILPTNHTSCKWLQSGVDPFKAKTVILSIKSTRAYEMGKGLNSGRFTMTPVSGIGEEAYLTSGSISYGAVISVRKSGGAFTITVRGYPDVATIAEKDKALAQIATF